MAQNPPSCAHQSFQKWSCRLTARHWRTRLMDINVTFHDHLAGETQLDQHSRAPETFGVPKQYHESSCYVACTTCMHPCFQTLSLVFALGISTLPWISLQVPCDSAKFTHVVLIRIFHSLCQACCCFQGVCTVLTKIRQRIVPALNILTSSESNKEDSRPSITWSSDRFTRGVAAPLAFVISLPKCVSDMVRVPLRSDRLHPSASTQQQGSASLLPVLDRRLQTEQ